MERPILFSGPMVRAILDGRKTVTRRIVSGAPDGACCAVYGPDCIAGDGSASPACAMFFDGPTVESRGLGVVRCPYGSPGDRLWVRETWMPRAAPCGVESFSNGVIYAATPDSGGGYAVHARESHADEIARLSKPGFTWRPSIHMPRWASRLTLEVVGIRVERLQEITEDDARAEGVDADTSACDHARRTCAEVACTGPGYRAAFADLWNEINGERASWASNPWVWVITFRWVP